MGNGSSTKFACLYLEYSESFLTLMATLYSELLASDSVELPGISETVGWFCFSGALLQWYTDSMSRLNASGFAQAIQKYLGTWSPCIFCVKFSRKSQLMTINITSGKFSKCLHMALSAKSGGVIKYLSQAHEVESPLQMQQVIGVF